MLWRDAPGSLIVTGALLPYLILIFGVFVICFYVNRRLNAPNARITRVLKIADKSLTLTRMLVLLVYFVGLFGLGYYQWLSGLVTELVVPEPARQIEHVLYGIVAPAMAGGGVGGVGGVGLLEVLIGLLIDVLVLIPPLLVIVATWWFYYPIDRRLRQATLFRQIESGGPMYSIWSRGEYLLSQVRHQLLLMLVPLGALLVWSRIAMLLPFSDNVMTVVEPVGALAVFVTAPFLMQMVWDTVPLPEGELRDRLTHLCELYKIKVRQILLWRTFGGMINGAVMGIIGRFRFILLTDALLDNMPTREVEAVMAHEIAHIKRHHMPFMLICAIASLGGLAWLVDNSLILAESYFPELFPTYLLYSGPYEVLLFGIAIDVETWWLVIQAVQVLFMLGVWFLMFGYVSRRFERQADTFAVQHFTIHPLQETEAGEGDSRVITREAAEVMISSLGHVASLNNHPVNKKSWRHGSIRWRMDYLRSLVGKPVDAVSIDREVNRLKLLHTILFAIIILDVWI